MNEEKHTARVAGISRLRFGTDGPGIRTLVALGGCRLDCAYCINAPLRSLSAGTPSSAEELLERVRIDNIYFLSSGGGVTFGGGEPLLRSAFIRRFREVCPPGWTLAVETSLNVPREDVERLLGVADHWIVDIKDLDPGRYLEYTGETNGQVLANLDLLRRLGHAPKVLVRIPWIRGLNTPEEALREAGHLEAQGFRTELFDYIIPENFTRIYTDRRYQTLPGSMIDLRNDVGENPEKVAHADRETIKSIHALLTTPIVGAIKMEDVHGTDWTD